MSKKKLKKASRPEKTLAAMSQKVNINMSNTKHCR